MQGNFARLSETRGGARARGRRRVSLNTISGVAGALGIGSVCAYMRVLLDARDSVKILVQTSLPRGSSSDGDHGKP